MIRHISRDADDDESASDLFGGLLESTGGLARVAGLDPTDPLNRLIASVQSRRERNSGEDREHPPNRGVGQSPNQPGSARKSAMKHAKETLEQCDRLYVLMREAEREGFELKRRIQAWNRLESGLLPETGTVEQESTSFMFRPSHSSACANVIACQLLQLWLRLFLVRPESVSISQEMVGLLLQDDCSLAFKSLHETKRSAAKEIALNSDQGSPLVLEILRQRLRASRDTSSAEVLGQILECGDKGSAMSQRFVDLAIEVMETEQGMS